MAFDFPNTPTTGQNVSGPNGAVWQWDGVKWLAAGSAILPDAPSDGNLYGRQNAAWTRAAPAAALNDVGRNLVHNPLFNVAQRGAGPWTEGGYTADRWVTTVSSDTISITQVALSDADRTAIGDESAQYALQNTFTGNAAAGAYNFISQPIERLPRVAGKTVTISFWAKAASGAPKLGVNSMQSFGNGGSPSPAIWNLTPGASVILSTTWTRYSVVVPLLSIIGKTLGTNGDSYNTCAFWYSSGSSQNANAGNIGVQSGTVQLWGVQLEIGSVATPLEKPDPQQDLAKCQRFFLGTGQQIQFVFNAAGGGVPYLRPIAFPVTMRTTPTIAMGGNSGNTNASGQGTANASPWGFDWTVTAAVAGLTGLSAAGYTASADL